MKKLFFFLILGVVSLFLIGCSKDDDQPNEPPSSTDNGGTWKVLGNLNARYSVYSITSDQNGNIYAAGDFRNSSDKRYVAKWNGTSWVDIGPGLNNIIREITCDKNGNLYAIGDFTDENNKYFISKWNGTSWTKIYDNLYQYADGSQFFAMAADNYGNVYFSSEALDGYNYYVTKWNGSNLSVVGSIRANWGISALATDLTGGIYAGGSFTNNSGNYYVAKWNGGSWADIGLNVTSDIDGICTDPLGNVYAKGGFKNTSNKFYIAKFSGGSWTDIGINANGYIYNICSDPFNNIYAIGAFTDGANSASGNNYVAKWNGSTWTNLGALVGMGNGGALHADKFGNVYASGFNSTNGVYVAMLKK